MIDVRGILFEKLTLKLSDYVKQGRIKLLHANEGYIFFTTPSLHKRFKDEGSGYWQDVNDLFFFTISFDLKDRGVDVELWLYGYQDERKKWLDKIDGVSPLAVIEAMKGHEKLYRQSLSGKKVKAADIDSIISAFDVFVASDLIKIENIILG